MKKPVVKKKKKTKKTKRDLKISISLSGFPTPEPPVCEAGLGLESYAIPDSAVTASSMVDIYHKPGNGRLHFQKVPSPLRYGAWATAGAHYLTAKDSWFQVDFGSWRKVTIIATQGRQDALQWVTKYRVSYSYDGIFFKDYMEGGYRKVLKSQIKVKITLLKNKFVVQSIVVPLCVAGWGWGSGGGGGRCGGVGES